MRTSDLQIVCVGNSHLASFSKSLKQSLEGISDVSLEFWPIQYMATQWNDFKSNSFLSSPKFNPGNPAGLQTADVTINSESVLVLVGLGLSGNFIFKLFGRLIYANPNEIENGYSCSPLMPYVHGNDVNNEAAMSHVSRRNAQCFSISMCNEMFSTSIRGFLSLLLQLRSNAPFKHIFSVPAPNMPERVARWRLGEDYCDSGCQRVINDAYRKKLRGLISMMEVSQNIITHDITFENHLGFIENAYANSHALNDNHVNQEYYNHIVSDLLARIEIRSDLSQ